MTLDTFIAEVLSIASTPPAIFSTKPTAIPAEDLIASGRFVPAKTKRPRGNQSLRAAA